MFAIPCDLGPTANTVEDVLGDDFNTIDYLWTWVVYKREEASERYVRLTLGSPLEIGESYWIFSQAGGFWDAGDGAMTTFTQDPYCTSPRGCYEIPLVVPADASSTRYNMVGHPGNIQTDWASVTFLVDGIPYTPYDAELNNFVANTLWKYNGNTYESYSDSTPGVVGYLDIYDGFWVKVLGGSADKTTVKMLVPYGTATGSPPGPPGSPGAHLAPFKNNVLEPQKPLLARLLDFFVPSVHAKKPSWEQEWYLRLTAVSKPENLADGNNVLGQLGESSDGLDRHDLLDLGGFGTPYLTLSFPIEDPGGVVESYTSNYHAVNTDIADQWVFEVKSDDPYRDIDLYWDGLYLLEGIWTQDTGKKTWSESKQMEPGKLYSRMVLEDVDLGVEIDAVDDDVVNHYSFNMDGLNVRTFRWIMKAKNGKPPKTKAIKSSPIELRLQPSDGPMSHIPAPGRSEDWPGFETGSRFIEDK